MKTMCPPGYHHNGFVSAHALGHRTSCAQVHGLTQSHCGDNHSRSNLPNSMIEHLLT